MAGATTPQLASAVANHGRLGVIPLGNYLMENCEKLSCHLIRQILILLSGYGSACMKALGTINITINFLNSLK